MSFEEAGDVQAGVVAVHGTCDGQGSSRSQQHPSKASHFDDCLA